MYRITILPEAEKSFKKIDKSVQLRITEKVDWLTDHADVIVHHQLSSLPDDLKGLCKLKVGHYRILYWIYFETQKIKIYNIGHRSEIYRYIKK